MKFTCESCNAQYMISDEKVGPSGVKVRCKKCGHVILVRRGAPVPAEAPAPAPAPSTGAGAAASGETAAASAGASASTSAPGLEAELGQAFDHAFGDAPAPAAAPAATPTNGADMSATQLMGSEDAAKVFADKPAAPTASEWYVAIGQAQVGPLPLAEVKKKWEGGEVGPDSLVWRPGMSDWAPLTTVRELAGYLAPVPRAAARSAEPRHEARTETPTPTPAEPSPTWKPMGASALAALASEEIAARASPEPRPAARPVQGVKSLMDALPDGGGVDPTGALPLNIKALEASTGEKKLERLSSVARGAEKARHRRSATRAVVAGILIGAAVVAGAAVGGMALYRKLLPPPAPTVAAKPAPSINVPLPPPPAAATPAPAPEPAPRPAVAASTPPAAAPAEPPAAKDATAARPERQAAAGTRRNAKGTAKAARAEAPPPPRKEPERVAQAEPPPPPKKNRGSLLDFESNDKALDEALGGSTASSGRSVYVPPARAGGSALPDKVSPGEINAAVAARIDALRRCVSEQKAREPDATGTLKMRWLIQGDGSASDVKCLTTQYAQGAFAQCIAGVVKSIKFPRSGTSGQEVTFPFNF